MFDKLRARLVEKLLEKDGLIAVPKGWNVEYVKLAGQVVRDGEIVDNVIKEYNSLLRDYYNKCTLKEIKDAIKDAGGTINKDATKEELVDIAVLEYSMKKEN